MSIIYEALKKTQQNLVKPSATIKPPKKPVSKVRKGIRVGLCVVLALLVVAQIKFPALIAKKVTPLQVAVIPPKPIPKMLLTGVFVSKGERLAVINNRMVHEGDAVEDLKVEKIDFEGVQLKRGQQRVTLVR